MSDNDSTGKKTTTKKKVGTAVGGVVVVGAAIALTAGTFSYFSDSASGDGTVNVTAGNLILGTGQMGTIVDGNIYPGWHKTTTLKLSNSGSLRGDLKVRLVNQGGVNNYLARNMEACLGAYSSSNCASLDHAFDLAKGPHDLGKMDAHSSKEFTVTLKFPESHTNQNSAQGQSIKIGYRATLTTEDVTQP